jgi:hypothetical protein
VADVGVEGLQGDEQEGHEAHFQREPPRLAQAPVMVPEKREAGDEEHGEGRVLRDQGRLEPPARGHLVKDAAGTPRAREQELDDQGRDQPGEEGAQVDGAEQRAYRRSAARRAVM